MLILLKFIHFVSFSLAIGGGAANMVLGIRASKMKAKDAGPLRLSAAVIGKIGTIALIFLWISGVWMLGVYQGFSTPLGTSFSLKMGAVVLLTVVSIYLNIKLKQAKKAGTPPDLTLVKRAGMGIGILSLLALVLALITFS